jgi:SAM-dependent methyltransferase
MVTNGDEPEFSSNDLRAASPLIIVGMHRAGTSATASLLAAAGVDIGRDLLAATSSNPRGHFENLDFVSLHQYLLGREGENPEGWRRRRLGGIDAADLPRVEAVVQRNQMPDAWGWKDPRTTLFLNFWAKLLPKAKFLLLYRVPSEIIDSLYRRGDKTFEDDPALAAQSTLEHFERMIDFVTHNEDRCYTLNIRTVLADPIGVVANIARRFQLGIRPPDDLPIFPEELHSGGLARFESLIEQRLPELGAAYRRLERIASISSHEELPLSVRRELAEWRASKHRVDPEDLHLRGVVHQLTVGSDVLVLNADDGLRSALMARNARSVLGICSDESSLQKAIARYGDQPHVAFALPDERLIPSPDAVFDVAIILEDNDGRTFTEALFSDIHRVLRPLGTVAALVSPNLSRQSGFSKDLRTRLLRYFKYVELFGQTFARVSLLCSLDREREYALACFAGNDMSPSVGLAAIEETNRLLVICSNEGHKRGVASLLLSHADQMPR